MTLRISRLGAALAVAGLFAVLPAVAGPLADKAAEAEALLGGGDTAGAVAAFDGATDAFWDALPFVFRTAVLADSVEGFGRYQPRANAAFRSGDTVTVYLEPVGYEFISAAGLYRAAFSTALTIRTPGGLILAESEDFGKIVWAGRSPSHEIPLTVSVALPDLKPGDYELALTLTDDAGGEMATAIFSLAITE